MVDRKVFFTLTTKFLHINKLEKLAHAYCAKQIWSL